jgi:hypothetical protein
LGRIRGAGQAALLELALDGGAVGLGGAAAEVFYVVGGHLVMLAQPGVCCEDGDREVPLSQRRREVGHLRARQQSRDKSSGPECPLHNVRATHGPSEAGPIHPGCGLFTRLPQFCAIGNIPGRRRGGLAWGGMERWFVFRIPSRWPGSQPWRSGRLVRGRGGHRGRRSVWSCRPCNVWVRS